VTVWGIDRVLSWLDQYAPDEAAFLRANLDRVHDHEGDAIRAAEEKRRVHLECMKRRAERLGAEFIREEKRACAAVRQAKRIEARKAAGGPVTPVEIIVAKHQARRDERCAKQPIGLIPDNVVERILAIDTAVCRRYRLDHGIPRYSTSNSVDFPSDRGSWRKLIDAWGVDRARMWVEAYMPEALATFERDTRPAPMAAASSPVPSAMGAPSTRRGEVWREKNRRIIAMNECVKKAKERDAALGRMPIVTPSLSMQPDENKQEERDRIADAMAEFLARGGEVKRLVGAGSPRVGQVLDVQEFGGVDA